MAAIKFKAKLQSNLFNVWFIFWKSVHYLFIARRNRWKGTMGRLFSKKVFSTAHREMLSRQSVVQTLIGGFVVSMVPCMVKVTLIDLGCF